MTTTTEDRDAQARAVDAVEQMLRLVAMARDKRDPVAWLEDSLLDMRSAITNVTQ